MNVGKEAIQAIRDEILRVDDEWSVRTRRGFRWWAHWNAQTIEVVGEGVGPDGKKDYIVSIRTEMLRGVPATIPMVKKLNSTVLPLATMFGVVHDPERETVELRTAAHVHEGNSGWMTWVLGTAALMQLDTVVHAGAYLADHLKVEEAFSKHPRSGERPEPDEMLGAIDAVIIPMGQNESPWTDDQFDKVVETLLNRPPALLGTGGGGGFTVEFPCGNESSLCEATTERYPRYGNGLGLRQSFRVNVASEAAGARLALSMNAAEYGADGPFGYGIGGYWYQDGVLRFLSFLPNALHRRVSLTNLYHSSVCRAQEVSARLTGNDWSEETFDPAKCAVFGIPSKRKRTRS